MKIFIADDHSIVRSGVTHLLTALGHEVVGEASSIDELLANINKNKADLLLSDYDMPNGELIPALRSIRAQQADLKIVILTGLKQAIVFKSLMENNIRINGLLMKNMPPSTLKEALECIESGENYIHTEIQQIIDNCAFSLTSRESQVLNLIIAGNSNSAIAEVLSVSVKTIDNHRASLMRKLKVNNIAQLIKAAQNAGLI